MKRHLGTLLEEMQKNLNLSELSTLKLDLDVEVDPKDIKVIKFFIEESFHISLKENREINISRVDYILKCFYLGMDIGDVISAIENDIEINALYLNDQVEEYGQVLEESIRLIEWIGHILEVKFLSKENDIIPLGVIEKLGLIYLAIIKKGK